MLLKFFKKLTFDVYSINPEQLSHQLLFLAVDIIAHGRILAEGESVQFFLTVHKQPGNILPQVIIFVAVMLT